MTLAEQLRRRAAQLNEFNRWKEEHPAPAREFSRILADLSAIRLWIPEPDRLIDPDPERLGVARLHAAIALLRPEIA
jgi:ferric-dicitrate binding protein FerR (iron transport regulator)